MASVIVASLAHRFGYIFCSLQDSMSLAREVNTTVRKVCYAFVAVGKIGRSAAFWASVGVGSCL